MQTPDFQPILTGAQVELRPLRADDWPEMFAAASDPLIWAGHPATDRYTEPAFRLFFDGGLASGMALAIRDRATNAMIGSSRYHGWDPVLREVEIGWTFLTRAAWGGATNREVKALMVAHALTFAEIVIFIVGETNLRSQRAMEKIGGVRRLALFHREVNGEMAAHVVYEMRQPLR